MSEQEFDVYLRLIAKLLRLNESQRDAISDELRDHMEARLEELIEGGMDREEAIHLAIEEFGDAAGLADQLTRVTTQHTIRRYLMKTGIGAIAAAAIALGFLYMLPHDRPGVPGPADTRAEVANTEPVMGAPGREAALVQATEESARTVQLLTQHIDVEYSDTRLEEVIGFLRYETGMNIVVNWAELEASGIDVDTPVSMVLKDTTPHTVLGLLIQLVNSSSGDLIDYTVMDDVIMITSADNISAMRVVRIYDCLDLMNPGASTAASPTAPVNALAVTPGRRGGRSANTGNFTAPGGMEMGGFDGGMGMDMQPTYGGGYGGGQANSFHRSADQATELLNVIHTLLDSHGSVSYYDGMLVVIAGHKTHQRIQETLMLVRATQAKR